jgi:hypothetical protein
MPSSGAQKTKQQRERRRRTRFNKIVIKQTARATELLLAAKNATVVISDKNVPVDEAVLVHTEVNPLYREFHRMYQGIQGYEKLEPEPTPCEESLAPTDKDGYPVVPLKINGVHTRVKVATIVVAKTHGVVPSSRNTDPEATLLAREKALALKKQRSIERGQAIREGRPLPPETPRRTKRTKLPKELNVDLPAQVNRHLCKNKRCKKPGHIVPGTRAENIQDHLFHKIAEAELELRSRLSVLKTPDEGPAEA